MWQLTRYSYAQFGSTVCLLSQTTDVLSLEESLARAQAKCEPLRREHSKRLREMQQALESLADDAEMTSCEWDYVCRHDSAKARYDEARKELERIEGIFNREFWERIQ